MSAINLINLGINYVNFRLCCSDFAFYIYGTLQIVTSIFLSKNFLHKLSEFFTFWGNDKRISFRRQTRIENIVPQDECVDREIQTENFDKSSSETSGR